MFFFSLIFAQNMEAVLTSTHNLCFVATIIKIGLPLHTPVLLYESGVQWGISRTCYPDCKDPCRNKKKM